MTIAEFSSGSVRLNRRWVLLGCAALIACQKTPVDAIVAESDGAAPDAEVCATGTLQVTPGQYRLRSAQTLQCLGSGSGIFVGGTPARLTTLSDACAGAGQLWQLIASTSNPGAFEIRVGDEQENLDIEMGVEAEGTRAILYDPNLFANQRFFLRSRRAGIFEIAPAHVTGATSCVSSSPPSPAIYRCDKTAVDQEWQLLPASCG